MWGSQVNMTENGSAYEPEVSPGFTDEDRDFGRTMKYTKMEEKLEEKLEEENKETSY